MRRQDKIKYLGFDDKWFTLAGIVVTAFIIPVAFFNYHFGNTTVEEYLMKVVGCAINGTIYWLGIRYFLVLIRKRMPAFEDTKKRLVYVILFVILYCGIAGGILGLLLYEINPKPVSYSFLQGYSATYFTSFFFLAVYESIYFYQLNERNILAKEAVKRAEVHAQLQSLRNQVNPHFLFNSMNTLMNIIPEDPRLAVHFLKKLSSVYRYILNQREVHLISLREELSFVESYVFLQKERFKNKLIVEIEIKEKYLEAYVLPLSLQLLVENAIKHNEVSNRHPLYIRVFVDEADNLVVQNNYQPKTQPIVSTGTGLKNIQSRLSYLTIQEMRVEQRNGLFVVAFPLLFNNSIEKTPLI